MTRLTLTASLLSSLLLTGCGSLPSGHGWGEDVALPGWSRLKHSAAQAASDPETWLPAAGALVFSLGDLDERVSDWATRDTPVFGSTKSASDASADLSNTLVFFALTTAIATPSGDNLDDWLSNKSRGILVEASAAALVSESTDLLKHQVDRRRPDDSDNLSFPSGRTSKAYAASTLASRNVNAMPLSNNSKQILRLGFKTMAAGTGWARVEARAHYPSDVLAGAALANFITSMIHDAFIYHDEVITMSVIYDIDTTGLYFTFRF